MRLSVLPGAVSVLVVVHVVSCGGSDFTGQATDPLPDASAGSSGDGGSGGSSGSGGSDSGNGGGSGDGGSSGGGSGSGGNSGSGGDSGHGGSTGGGASGASGTGVSGGTGGVIAVDAGADVNCASPMLFFPDTDGDGFGTQSGAVLACERLAGTWATRAGDCNDGSKDVNPDQKTFFGVGYDARDGRAFDYDCNGREEADPSQFGGAPDCTGLNLGMCRGSGFGPTNRSGAGIDPLCGSTALVECKVVDVVFCGAEVSQVSPKRCR